jgi:integrase
VTARDQLGLFEEHPRRAAIRVAAYSGVRLGELLALRSRNIDWRGSTLTISCSLSSRIEGATKTGPVRVPMVDQAAAALDWRSQRADFTPPDDCVFCNALGRRRAHRDAGRELFITSTAAVAAERLARDLEERAAAARHSLEADAGELMGTGVGRSRRPVRRRARQGRARGRATPGGVRTICAR